MKTILLKVLEFFELKVICGTGSKAPYSGLYRCEQEYIALTKGERFPPYKDQKKGVQWILVVSI